MQRHVRQLFILLVALGALVGCDRMREQRRVDPYEYNEAFAHGLSARPLPMGSVARGHLREDREFYTGKRIEFLTAEEREKFQVIQTERARGQGQGPRAVAVPEDRYVAEVPLPITRELLELGQEQFTIHCSVCHGATGNGDGMIVQRGFPRPPSYHIERLRNDPDGRLYDVITNGYGLMYSYKNRIKPHERWAIVAYIRALQLSQNATLEDVPEDVAERLQQAEAGAFVPAEEQPAAESEEGSHAH